MIKPNKIFKIEEVFKTSKGHSLFHLIFKSRYEMGMFFLRYQEFYESINPEFRDKSFRYLDYLSWYTQYTNQSTFTYPKDFIGYNLPSDSIIDCYSKIPRGDKNKYDNMMNELVKELSSKSQGKFYIIGTIRKDSTYHHEIAHALYYLDPAYKKQMDFITGNLSQRFKRSIFNVLATIYPEKVFNDELQAYMSTNSAMAGMDEISGFSVKCKKYEKVYNDWLRKIGHKI